MKTNVELLPHIDNNKNQLWLFGHEDVSDKRNGSGIAKKPNLKDNNTKNPKALYEAENKNIKKLNNFLDQQNKTLGLESIGTKAVIDDLQQIEPKMEQQQSAEQTQHDAIHEFIAEQRESKLQQINRMAKEF